MTEKESIKKFASQFTAFMDSMTREADDDLQQPLFVQALTDHFRQAPSKLPVLIENFGSYDHVNFQLALDGIVAQAEYETVIIGFQGEHTFERATFSALLNKNARYFEGPVVYANFEVPSGDTITGIQNGLVLLSKDDGTRYAILITGPHHYERQVKVEVMALDKGAAQGLLSLVREQMLQCNAYRGKIISVTVDDYRQLDIRIHHLPEISRSNIILQEGVLSQVEQLTIKFAERAERLKAAGRHIKRGLLLHGPPGTGKTLTAMYLAGAMEGRTVLLMTGQDLGLLESTVSLARALAPAMVVLEDVDLIAEERTRQSGCTVPLLFELLNQMDGLAPDVDLIFLLTTNRPEILEPALSARPGRIDQAIEIPLPDIKCRTRLFDLYGKGLNVQVKDSATFVQRTEGASAAFIKELFRRAALYGDDDGDTIAITDKHLDDALHELLARGGQLTQSLLGFQK